MSSHRNRLRFLSYWPMLASSPLLKNGGEVTAFSTIQLRCLNISCFLIGCSNLLRRKILAAKSRDWFNFSQRDIFCLVEIRLNHENKCRKYERKALSYERGIWINILKFGICFNMKFESETPFVFRLFSKVIMIRRAN